MISIHSKYSEYITALLSFEFKIKILYTNENVWLGCEELIGGEDKIGA